MTPSKPRVATPRQINQILGFRLFGIVQTTNIIPGRTTDIQIKCIDTNASVGGSQPHEPQNWCISGMPTAPNNVDPNTDKPTKMHVPTSFVENFMRSESDF